MKSDNEWLMKWVGDGDDDDLIKVTEDVWDEIDWYYDELLESECDVEELFV
jgi:hypothetical protein